MCVWTSSSVILRNVRPPSRAHTSAAVQSSAVARKTRRAAASPGLSANVRNRLQSTSFAISVTFCGLLGYSRGRNIRADAGMERWGRHREHGTCWRQIMKTRVCMLGMVSLERKKKKHLPLLGSRSKTAGHARYLLNFSTSSFQCRVSELAQYNTYLHSFLKRKKEKRPKPRYLLSSRAGCQK